MIRTQMRAVPTLVCWLVFVCFMFRFHLHSCVSVLFDSVVLDLISAVPNHRLAGEKVSEMTCFVSIGGTASVLLLPNCDLVLSDFCTLYIARY